MSRVFFLFFLYNIDLHNLSFDGMDLKADPRNDFRWDNNQILGIDWSLNEITEDSLLVNGLENLAVHTSTVCNVEMATARSGI